MQIKRIKELCCDFLSQSSMHGLKYIAQPNRSWMEKTIWILAFVLGMVLSIFLSREMFQKFTTYQLLTSIQSTHEPLSHFDFPSVTVCSQNRFSKLKLKQIRQENWKLQELTEDDLILAMKVMIKLDSGYNRANKLRFIQQALDYHRITPDEMMNFTLQVMLTCEDILLDCKWQDQEIPCSQLFTLRPTDVGYCCGFNYRQWYLNGTEIPHHELATEIFERVNIAGYNAGLRAVLDTRYEEFATYIARSDGFKVLVHSPTEHPQAETLGFNISPGFETFSGIGPNCRHHSKPASMLSIKHRQCHKTSDTVLEFYGQYSSSNCLVECLTRHMLLKCNCRPFFLPAAASDRICNLEEHVCLSNAAHEFKDDPFPEECLCLPRCHETWYSTELSVGTIPGEGFLHSNISESVTKNPMNLSKIMLKEYYRNNVAILNVYYNKPVGYVYQTDIAFKWQDLISAVGGLLGLGVGFSFISLVEILYFFGVRIFLKEQEVAISNRKLEMVGGIIRLNEELTRVI